MRFIDILAIALSALRQQKTRSSLTLLGVVLGTFILVTSLSLGKAAARALTKLLASEYGPAGVHVATVIVAGAVAPGGPYDPDLIAGHYWRLHTQPPQAWEHEVVVGAK